MNVLNILTDINCPMAIDNINTPKLAPSCQPGISDTPILNIVMVGAVIGKIESTTQIGCSGIAIKAPKVHKGMYPAMI